MSSLNPIRTIDQLDWQSAIDHWVIGNEDKFALTFRAKANAMKLWPYAMGIRNNQGKIFAGIVVKVNKTQPVANLQLLHTFSVCRRRGFARLLTEHEFDRCRGTVSYFRVSSEEEALPFYRSLGFKFWGRQKSGSCLSMFRIVGSTIAEGEYNVDDPVIRKALFTKARGGLVEHFKEGPC